MITLDEARKLEQAAPLRIKFASLDANGNLLSDSNAGYPQFFTHLLGNWHAVQIGDIETRDASRPGHGELHRAWDVSNGELNLLAVEHETGIELIAAIGVGIMTDAAVGFLRWAWRQWREVRSDLPYPPVSSSVVIEVPRADPDAPPVRIVVGAPVTDDELARYVRLAVSTAQSN
ncbi:hypothetical protein [Streptomyces sp. NPDC054940]